MYWQVKKHEIVTKYLALYDNKLNGVGFLESNREKAVEWLTSKFPEYEDFINDKKMDLTQDIIIALACMKMDGATNAGRLITQMVIEVKELWENFMDEVRPEAIGWI